MKAFDLSSVLAMHDQLAVEAFVKAAGDGDLQAVEAFISKYGVSNINAANSRGVTALHAAAFDGRDEVIDFLLKHGAKVDSRDSKGRTPLMLAAMKGNASCADLFLKGGADPEAQDNDNKDVLWIARGGPIQMYSHTLAAVGFIKRALLPKQRAAEEAARAAAAKAAREREEHILQAARNSLALKRPLPLPRPLIRK